LIVSLFVLAHWRANASSSILGTAVSDKYVVDIMRIENINTHRLLPHRTEHFDHSGAKTSPTRVFVPIASPVCVAERPNLFRYIVRNGMRHALLAAKRKLNKLQRKMERTKFTGAGASNVAIFI
jgi:hypothetical protein